MWRIKVTGYIFTEDLTEKDMDRTDPTGLSGQGHLALSTALSTAGLNDIEFEREDD